MDAGLGRLVQDPLLCTLELPLRASFFPLGFHLDIATNSADVIEAAAQAWGLYSPEYHRPPLSIRVIVQPDGDLAPQPVFRLQRHLMTVVSDSHNYAVADLEKLFATIYVSRRTAADHMWLRWYFVESMAYILLVQRYLIAMHAACVVRNGAGLLLAGASGAGKSTLSFACARAGWTFVADDCTWLLADSNDPIVIGKPHQVRFRHDSPRHFPELEGYLPRARPNGKLSMEVPTSDFPNVQTAPRCQVSAIVFLDRGAGLPRLDPVTPAQASDLLVRDMSTYGDEVSRRHERGIQRLLTAPAWRMRYQTLDEALLLLDKVTPPR